MKTNEAAPEPGRKRWRLIVVDAELVEPGDLEWRWSLIDDRGAVLQQHGSAAPLERLIDALAVVFPELAIRWPDDDDEEVA